MLYYIEPQYSEHLDITYFLTFSNRVRYIEVLLYNRVEPHHENTRSYEHL